jgi:hypothetical protein
MSLFMFWKAGPVFGAFVTLPWILATTMLVILFYLTTSHGSWLPQRAVRLTTRCSACVGSSQHTHSVVI